MPADTLANHMLMTQKKQSATTDRAPHPDNHPVAGDRTRARPLILIVEDEPDVAELMRYNLAREGYATFIAESGDAAVEAALTSSPDLILLDIMLPGMNGWEVCRTIRTSVKDRLTPIIMVSALTAEESRIKGLSLGADDYVTKPFSVQELLLKTRNIVNRHARINELEAREREQDTSTRYLLHEMRSALSIIGGFSSLAARKGTGSPYLDHINSSALHMEALIDDISLLARMESGRGSLPREAIDIAEISLSLADSFREKAAQRSISLTIEAPSSLKAVGNATAFRQILANLISNAIKYNRDYGSVRVTCEAIVDRAVLSIIDTGPGIRQEELEQIFHKFYRARGSESVPGSGLGLYIAKLLAETMGGNMSVTSSLGEGSVFSLILKRQAGAGGRSTGDE